MSMQTLKISLSENISFDLIYIEGGTFLMGDDKSKPNREKPAHQVKLGDFYLGKYQVTQNLWEAVMGENPSGFVGERRPVEQVSWNEVQNFLKKMSTEIGKTFRLPSEAEWEYAARGGKYSQGFIYAGSDKLKQVGWYEENSNNETHEVGLLLANELGLYDMSGNVWEWCEDDFHKNYRGAPDDGSAWIDSPMRGARRVLRGGGYLYSAERCRPAYRFRGTPGNRSDFIGFRLVLPLQSVG